MPALTSGTRTETITNSFESVIDSKSYDIASGLLLRQSIATAVDAVGRPTHIIHDGDADDFEEFTYACCGVKTHRSRDGSLTEYTADPMGRPTQTKVTLGSKVTTTAYSYTSGNFDGRSDLPKTTVTQTVTAGSNNTGSLPVSETIENLRGQTLVSITPDATGDSTPETTTYTYNPAARTSSYTSAIGTTTSTYFADGQLATNITKVGAIAITPLTSYDYAPHNQNGGGIRTTVQLFAENLTLKTENSFSDLAGRTFRTESPGYNGATLVSTTTFDARGRATGQSSTGRPSTLRVLNALGETTESWTDSNGDGQFNDTTVNGIKDSVSKSQSDYTTEDGNICRRNRQWIRSDNNTDILLSTTFSGVDGTYQKSVPLPGTGPITVTTAAKPLNGNSSSETRTYLAANSYLATLSASTLNADGTTTSSRTSKTTENSTLKTENSVSDLQGRTTSVVGERGLTTTYSDFTDAGQPLGVTSQGTYTKTTLDSQGRVTTSVTRKTSDNSVIATVFTTYEQTTAGLITRRWGTNNYPTLTKQDLQGRTVELRTYQNIPASSLETENLTLDPSSGSATTWNYETATGLLLSKRDSDEKGADYTYTPDGKLLTRTWARAITATYDHTSGGQIKTVNYSDSTPDVTISYNRLGQRLSVSNGLAASGFTYDPVTLALDKETITYTLPGQESFIRVLDRSRDNLGRASGYDLGSAPASGAGGGAPASTLSEVQATYTYSPTTGRFETVAGNSSGTFTYGYEPNSSLLKTVTRPGILENQPTLRVTNTWEPNRDVLLTKANELVTGSAATDISSITYNVNELGQRKHATRTGAFTNGTTWDYDNLGQVISADDDSPAADRAYQYDTIGNRKKSANSLTLPEADNYTANQLNQYTKANGESLPADSYDLDGNQLNARILPLGSSSLASCVYHWDAENRLTSVTSPNGEVLVSYRYDAFSRLIARGEGVPPTTWTTYVYDRWNRIAQYNGTTLSKTYLWGLDLSGSFQGAGGVGGLLAVNTIGGAVHYPTYDGNGNISEYLTAAGTVAAHFEYDPFGNTVVASGDAAQFAYRFSTKPIDSATGLYYYGYRWYDPLTGRWPSRDPIEEEGGLNLYGFVKNAGVDDLDINGLLAALDDESKKRLSDLATSPTGRATIAAVEEKERAFPGMINKLIDEVTERIESIDKGTPGTQEQGNSWKKIKASLESRQALLRQALAAFVANGNQITIEMGDEANGHGGLFYHNTFKIILAEEGIYYRCSEIYFGKNWAPAAIEASASEILNHELIHARDRLSVGTTVDWHDFKNRNKSPKWKNTAEKSAMEGTNPMEDEAGVPRRKDYFYYAHEETRAEQFGRVIRVSDRAGLSQDEKGKWHFSPPLILICVQGETFNPGPVSD